MSSVKRNFIYNSFYQMFAIIVPIISTPYLSRVLGANGIGEYAYAYSIAYYFSLFIKLGLNNYGNRTIASVRDDKIELSKCFWNIYFSQIFFGIFVLIVYSLVIICFKQDLIAELMLLLLISNILDITWFFSGIEAFKIISLRDFCIKLFTIILIFVFVKDSNDIWKYTLIMTMGMLISQLLLWLLLKNKIIWIKPVFKEIIRHLKPNLILFVPTIAVSLYKIMDKIMLGGMAGQIEVGYYESCERVLNVPLALINALGTVMLPHISYLYARNGQKERVCRIFRNSEHFMVIVSSVISFGIMTVASDFVPLFYGKGFSKCVILFYILLPSSIFLAFANVIRTQYLIPLKKDKEYIISLFCGAIINLVVNFCLIPKLQSVGAAIGTLFAEMLVCIIQIILVQKQLPVLQIVKECLVYVGNSILMFSISAFIPRINTSLILNIIIKIIVGAFIWIILMLRLYLRKNTTFRIMMDDLKS